MLREGSERQKVVPAKGGLSMRRMRTLSGLWAGAGASMQIPFAAVNPDSGPPRQFLRNRFETHIKNIFFSL